MPDTIIGQEIDGFQILDELGRGGMGVVYKAEDVALARPVALKMIARDLARDESFVRRFRSEARALARINSSYITSIYALRRTDLGIFIVMEFIGGGTLGDMMERGPLKWSAIRPIVLEMITALEHAHGVGIIHRDIKPGNILITESGHVKVTDFGLAKLHAPDKAATVTQGIAGTLYYMSPEQVKGERNLDGRSDLYALGVTIYEALSGRLPFDRGGSEFSTMRKIVEDPYPPLGQFVPDLPTGLEAAVMKALEKSADDRYPNAAAMRAAFEAIPGDAAPQAGGAQPSRREAETVVAGAAYEKQPASPVAVSASPAQPKRKLMVGGGVLAAVVLAAIAYFLWPSGPTTPLSVTTDPPGAAVYFDGRSLGRTPLDADVEGDGGRLRVDREGYAILDTTIAFAEGQPLALSLPLVPVSEGDAPVAMLEVESNPSGATVYVNDERVGETPYTHRDDSGRPIAVRIERTGYQPYIRRGILLQPGEPTTLQADLSRVESQSSPARPVETPPETQPTDSGTDDPPPAQFFGTLTLTAEPAGTVQVDGESARNSGEFRLPAGTHTIRCENSQYGSFQATVRVRAGQNETATCHFRARVNVVATTEEGGATWGAIWVDGSFTGDNTPRQLLLGPGTHTIEVRRDGYQTLEPARTLSIEAGLEPQSENLTFTLRRE